MRLSHPNVEYRAQTTGIAMTQTERTAILAIFCVLLERMSHVIVIVMTSLYLKGLLFQYSIIAWQHREGTNQQRYGGTREFSTKNHLVFGTTCVVPGLKYGQF
jgi:hypothetical protein